MPCLIYKHRLQTDIVDSDNLLSPRCERSRHRWLFLFLGLVEEWNEVQWKLDIYINVRWYRKLGRFIGEASLHILLKPHGGDPCSYIPILCLEWPHVPPVKSVSHGDIFQRLVGQGLSKGSLNMCIIESSGYFWPFATYSGHWESLSVTKAHIRKPAEEKTR